MAQFESSDFPIAGGDPNQYLRSQQNSLANLGAQQSLANQATFRDNTAGLVAGDPAATAAALGGDPSATTSFLGTAGPNLRAQAAANLSATGSLAAATLNAPADQRAAVYSIGRQALAANGYGGLPPETYPGDESMLQLQRLSLPVPEQLKYTPQPLSANPVPVLQTVPGNGSVGPGGTQGGAPAQGDPNAAGGPSSTYANKMMAVESNGDPTAQNPMSSAHGAGQFIDSTWLDLLPQVRPDLAQGRTPQQQLALKNDPTVSTQMVNGYAQQNAPKLAAAGLPVNDTTLALAHRFGPDVAIQVASADPRTPIGNIVGPQVMGVNPDLRGQTAGSIAGFYAQRVGAGAPVRTQVASAGNTNGAPQTANDASPQAAPVAPPPTAPAAAPVAPIATPAAPAGPSTPTNRLTALMTNLRAQTAQGQAAPAADPDQAVAVDNLAAGAGLPAGTQVRLPTSVAAPAAAPAAIPQRMPLARADEQFPPAAAPQGAAPATPAAPAASAPPVAGQANALAPLGVAAGGAPVQNTLAPLGSGMPSAAAPNLLAGAGSPQPTVMQPPVAASPQPPQYPFVRDPMTRAYVPVPNQPGYAYAQGPRGAGDLYAQLIPGAPAAGYEMKTTPSGDIVSQNRSTGVTTINRAALPNTARTTTVNDGSTIHLFQPGSGEVASVPLQPNVQEVQSQVYAEDRKAQSQQVDVAQLAQQQQVRLLEAREALQGLPTGAGGDARTAWSAWAETYLPQTWADQFKAKLGLPNAVPAQQFGKLMTQTAGNQVQGVTGGRAGIGIMSLFKANNPGLQLQPNANRDLLNAQLVATQADADYARGFNDFVNENGKQLIAGRGYTPASNYDQQWLAQRNPQVNVAAAEAMSGNPFSFWSKGLSPAEGARAMQVIGRIDPTMTVQGKAGPLPVRQFMGAPQ